MSTTPDPLPDAPDELDLDREVRRLINLHRGQWRAIEAATGVSYSWLSKFARGKIQNPGYATLKRLHALLAERPVPQSLPPLPPPKPPTTLALSEQPV